MSYHQKLNKLFNNIRFGLMCGLSSDEQFLKSFFHQSLNRQIEPHELDKYQALLGQGLSRKMMIRQIMNDKNEVSPKPGQNESYQTTPEEFLTTAYKELLERPIDAIGLAHFTGLLQQGHSRSSILLDLVKSDEFMSKLEQKKEWQRKMSDWHQYDDSLKNYEHHFNKAFISTEQYEKLWHDLNSRYHDDYLLVHKQRYYELFNVLAHFHDQNKSLLLLEIGPSIFLPMYRQFFPNLRLVTLDRPLEHQGAQADYCLDIGGAERHYHADLTEERLSPEFGTPVLGLFDFISCTEVIEHLLINPVYFIQDLLSLLTSDGVLYLTTPNFFSRPNLQSIAAGENPQQVYPGKTENWDGHHHLREFGMKELHTFVELAGGDMECAYFSHCWDDPHLVAGYLAQHPEEKSNLVIIAKRKGSGTKNAEN
ncbi:DUF4214 domain-containing protein [candidate division CSSED10-310 bacterium]|uniref:DUF4214 domain-containing protein n=1 Tax=candidate division CSSED10-310 bacterium TaxID=2855610 RepID=A0ABV6Z4L7_UNCC1